MHHDKTKSSGGKGPRRRKVEPKPLLWLSVASRPGYSCESVTFVPAINMCRSRGEQDRRMETIRRCDAKEANGGNGGGQLSGWEKRARKGGQGEEVLSDQRRERVRCARRGAS